MHDTDFGVLFCANEFIISYSGSVFRKKCYFMDKESLRFHTF
jgi:hypothetical protein